MSRVGGFDIAGEGNLVQRACASRYLLGGPLSRRHNARLLGKGEDVVVFSHGFGTDQRSWRAVVQHLEEGFRCLLFDLPGAGPLLPEGFDPDNYRSLAPFADDLLNLLDEVGVSRCRYVGHSVSGMIGVLAALEAPEKFEKLILLNASPRYLNDDGYGGGFDRADIENLLEAMAANYQGWVAGFAPLAIADDTPHAVMDFSSGLLEMRPDVAVRIARTIFQSDLRNLLPMLAVPTLLVHSRGDIAVPETVADYLRSQIAGSELVWIKNVGHLPHLSAPDEVAQLLQKHLA